MYVNNNAYYGVTGIEVSRQNEPFRSRHVVGMNAGLFCGRTARVPPSVRATLLRVSPWPCEFIYEGHMIVFAGFISS